MNRRERTKQYLTREKLLRGGAVLAALAFVVYTVMDPKLSGDALTQNLLQSTLSRVLGSLVFLFVLLYQQSGGAVSVLLPACIGGGHQQLSHPFRNPGRCLPDAAGIGLAVRRGFADDRRI